MPTVTIGNNTGDDYAGTEDAQIKSNNSSANYGGRTNFECTKYASGNHTHALLGFSGLSNLPSSITVSDSSLNIYCVGHSDGERTITARRLLRSWIEGTANGQEQSGSCSWSSYGGGNWTTSGALSDGNDRSSTVSGTGSLKGSGWLEISGSQLNTDIQNGYQSWHLERTDGADDHAYDIFTSSEGSDGNRPYVSVTYEENASSGSVVPRIMQSMSQFTGGLN